MSAVATVEAEPHLSPLLDRVEKGERVTITRDGRPVAELVPVRQWDRDGVRSAIREIEALTKDWSLGMPVEDAIRAGRKY